MYLCVFQDVQRTLETSVKFLLQQFTANSIAGNCGVSINIFIRSFPFVLDNHSTTAMHNFNSNHRNKNYSLFSQRIYSVYRFHKRVQRRHFYKIRYNKFNFFIKILHYCYKTVNISFNISLKHFIIIYRHCRRSLFLYTCYLIKLSNTVCLRIFSLRCILQHFNVLSKPTHGVGTISHSPFIRCHLFHHFLVQTNLSSHSVTSLQEYNTV